MGDVTDQADRHAREITESFTDREDVEQALRGVFVGPVARVDHAYREVLGQEVGRARSDVPHDHGVDPHRLEILGRVDERLALREAA